MKTQTDFAFLKSIAIWAVVLSTGAIQAETVKDRAGAVLGDRASMESNSRWIYNDWRAGFEQASREGKPLLVVLRCVPCLACMGIDAGVLTDKSLRPLLSQFVCVRVINANALDLKLFQFDYDLSFSAILFNGDGTVYGRFGSWTHQKNSQDSDIAGFRRALEGALALHREYPANQEKLQGKQGVPLPVNDPLQLPELAGKYERELDWDGKVVQSCVHCHQVSDAMRSSYRDQNQPIPRKLIYPMPPPETIGLSLDPANSARVTSVAAASIAAKAGIQAGDEFTTLGGQPLISVADFSWVLHHAPESGALNGVIRRDRSSKTIKLDLPEGWRAKADIARRVGTWAMRAMAAGGLQLEDVPDEERAKLMLDAKALALRVKHAGEFGKHAAAKKAGFQNGDIIIRIDGRKERTSESELIGWLLEKNLPGESVETLVLRGSERIRLSLPMQ